MKRHPRRKARHAKHTATGAEHDHSRRIYQVTQTIAAAIGFV